MDILNRCLMFLLLVWLPWGAFPAQQTLVDAIQNARAPTLSQSQWLRLSVAANNAFVFNPRTHRWYAYNGRGRLVKSGRASGGANYCPDIGRACRTPSGSYRIISKRGASCRSSRYPKGRGGAPMPYCMFFSKYYAVHGSYDVPNRNASHGCIRVTPAAAKWLYRNFMHIGTRVIIKSY